MNSSQSPAGLRKGAVGAPGIVFFVVAAAGPMAATVGAGPVTFMANGVGSTGTYVIAALVMLVFAVGFAAISRHVSSTGGFAVLISRGLGERWGFAGAAVALLAYSSVLIGIVGLFSFFTNSIILGLFGWDIPWPLLALGVVLVVALLGYRDINLSARILGALMVLEVVSLVVFAVIAIASGGDSGLSARAFDPAQVFSGSPGLAFLFAFSAFIGFEATVIYGEEAKDPKRSVPLATYIAVALIGGFYVLVTYAIGIGYGPDKVVDAAMASPATFVFDINTRYVGEWATIIMKVLVITSLFAVLLSLHNTVSRYVFALGRGGFLRASLGTAHPRHASPHRASLVVTAVTAVVVIAFIALGADPFLDLYSWLVGLGTLGVLLLQLSASAAVIGFFRRNRVESNPWKTIVAPALGGLGLLAVFILALVNFGVLTGVTSGPITVLPALIPIVAAVGLAWGIRQQKRGASLDSSFQEDHA